MKQQVTRILCAVIFAFAVLALPVQATETDKAQAIENVMTVYHDYGLFNGSVLVAENGKVIFKKGYGLADMEWNIPNTPDTRFRLGSITKQFTSMIIMQLVEQGKIKLDAPISIYLPDYRKDIGDKVTIHHLLTHTSGIPSYTGFPGFFANDSRDPYTPDAFIKKYCSRDLEFEPGTEFKYNNSAYFILGAIIEHVTGKPYATVIRENIFEPLGMDASGYDLHAPIIPKRAAGYERGPDGYVNAPYLDMTIPYAAGSLYSTVEDLYTWDRALYTDRLLSPEMKAKLFTPYMKDYGYGWSIRTREVGDQTVNTIGHGGGINGFNTLITRYVDDQHLVVLLNNTGGTKLGDMTEQIANILYGEPVTLPKKPADQVLLNTYRDKGVAAGDALFAKLQADGGYDLNERMLNNLGYGLLGLEKVDEAIAVFAKNTELYPDSANTWDSLAEGYLTKGDRENAIRYYRKTLELKGDNPNAVEQLNKLGVTWKKQ